MKKVIGLLRILLGVGILYFGGMKIFAGAGMEPISAAVDQFGLGFLSDTVWFWVVALTEVIAGILLLLGRKHKIGAFLVLLITVVAIATVGWNWNNGPMAIIALILLFTSSGAWSMERHDLENPQMQQQ